MVDLADVAVGDLDDLPSFFAMDKLVSMAIGSRSLSHNIVGGHLSAIKAESKWETDHLLEAVISGIQKRFPRKKEESRLGTLTKDGRELSRFTRYLLAAVGLP
ncbi:hypothetical protein B0H14DRAFT_2641170 [Mycena olivaceomarginata]|nr:hypothetical protein B0H14DRAFT_2641170 [Mycena olivaceomarginata]